ncbi:MAG TPA: hypothetical protein VK855_08165 [Thioalkalivibrio sp.]|nr:hypothetical protein [Thioalkalivibrio sp.]
MNPRSNALVSTEIPMRFRLRGGQAIIVLPDGARAVARKGAKVDNTMVKLMARGFRWQRLLESGAHATIEDLAAAEKINASYVSRILRLAFLAPDIVEVILDGKHPSSLTAKRLLEPFPTDWAKQRRHFID